MSKKIEIDPKIQIEMFAEMLARILIQQVQSKIINSKIEKKYGK